MTWHCSSCGWTRELEGDLAAVFHECRPPRGRLHWWMPTTAEKVAAARSEWIASMFADLEVSPPRRRRG